MLFVLGYRKSRVLNVCLDLPRIDVHQARFPEALADEELRSRDMIGGQPCVRGSRGHRREITQAVRKGSPGVLQRRGCFFALLFRRPIAKTCSARRLIDLGAIPPSSGESAITASCSSAGIVSLLLTGFSAHSNQRSKASLSGCVPIIVLPQPLEHWIPYLPLGGQRLISHRGAESNGPQRLLCLAQRVGPIGTIGTSIVVSSGPCRCAVSW